MTVLDDELRIELTVPERVLSLHEGTIIVPLRQIARVVVVDNAMSEVRGSKMPGTRVPGVLAVGTWRGDQAGRAFLDFVAVHRPGPGVVISLRGARYDRIVLDHPRAYELAEQLSERVRASGGRRPSA